jgi:hypothetical protein
MPRLDGDKQISADVTTAQVKGLEIGDTVTVMYTGKVVELRAAEKYDYGDSDKGEYPPVIGVKVSKMKVTEGVNAFGALAEDEDED